ncbi:MAG: hypothetical protein KDK66_03815 [Deltaproteobacteria bacterium]|nr:hypothetical protein [Deltaproteobacteria bacterium]
MSKVSRKSSSPLSPLHPPAADGVEQTTPAQPKASPDSFSQASKLNLGSASSMLKNAMGAMKLFGDNVILPSSLTDPNNPANDSNYLRLFAAVLGLDDLEKYFFTLEGEEQEAYLEHKADQLKVKRRQEEEEKEGQASDEEGEGDGEQS